MDSEIQQHLRGMAEVIDKVAADHQKLAEEVHQKQQEAAAEKMVEALTKLVSISYDKSIAYTNLLIVAGYASFFALWGATKPVLTEWVTIAAALLMVLSATAFVLFETFKMIHSSRFFFRHQGLLADPEARKNPHLFQSTLNEFEALQRKESLRFVRVWIAVLWFTVSTAVLAVALLAGNYFYLILLVAQGRGGWSV